MVPMLHDLVSGCERLLASLQILLHLWGKGVGILSLQLLAVDWHDFLVFELPFVLLLWAVCQCCLCSSLFFLLLAVFDMICLCHDF